MPNPITSAWLTGAQLPDDAHYQWAALGAPRAMPFAQDIGAPLCPGMDGENAWLVQDYRGTGISAAQQTFLFATEADASQAYGGVVAGVQRCQAHSRSMQAQYGAPTDAVVAEITGTTHSSAWARSWAAVNTPISGGGPQTDIEYIAQQGRAISFLDYRLPGLDRQAPDVTSSAALLATMTSELAAYRAST